MGPIDLFWHLVNLFAVGVLFSLIASAGARVLWRERLGQVRWLRLLGWPAAAASAVTLGGLLLFGRDGRMATYALMVFAVAAVLGWLGVIRRG